LLLAVLELEVVTTTVLEDTGAVDVEFDGVELVTTLEVAGGDVTVGVEVVVGVDDVVGVEDVVGVDVVDVPDIGATTSKERSQYTS